MSPGVANGHEIDDNTRAFSRISSVAEKVGACVIDCAGTDLRSYDDLWPEGRTLGAQGSWPPQRD